MVNKVKTSACLLRCCIISSSTNKDFLKNFIFPQMCSMYDRSGLQAGQLSKQAYCFIFSLTPLVDEVSGRCSTYFAFINTTSDENIAI